MKGKTPYILASSVPYLLFLRSISLFLFVEFFSFQFYIRMSGAPSLAHCFSYYCTATRRKVRKGSHASSSISSSISSPISSSDCLGASLKSCGNSTGLGIFSYNVSFGYQKMGKSQGGTTVPYNISEIKRGPDHLLVLVHGIFASPKDWTYAEAELKRQLGSNFLIYVSSSNTYTKTFSGIDGAGKRLADEVLNIVQKTESLRKISFLAHSLGGLFSRYAIAILYSSDNLNSSQRKNFIHSNDENPDKVEQISALGQIAGLEPINFITLATPHLGVRGKKQLPFLLGLPFLEKLAAPLAPIFTGRTGRQLFLDDGEPKQPPLLLRMASDNDDLKFLSSLAAFINRIIYANVSYDHMVGWRTSSIRRESELIKLPQKSLGGYKHIVNVQYCPPIISPGPHFPPEAARAKEAAKNVSDKLNIAEYHDIMEEEMIHGLQRLGWKKVDVSFHSALMPFFAHNNIHVKSEWFHNAGAGVIAHVTDSLKQQESRSLFSASL